MDAEKEKLLRDIYYDAARGLGGKQALWRRVQREHPGEFRKAAVMAWVDKQALAQVNALVKACFVDGEAVPDADALIAKLA